ncbi:hypothetical protein E2C01_037353 [Portunus trituberculatus]|uniref:Transposase Tc1-like domain-containing protein n=1 Tax=Portunus trituberculatus TaxID=210409 RepID=A0A5B7F945_PORTR|nr:hypothetical protein [Portunus trituberculatus]
MRSQYTTRQLIARRFKTDHFHKGLKIISSSMAPKEANEGNSQDCGRYEEMCAKVDTKVSYGRQGGNTRTEKVSVRTVQHCLHDDFEFHRRRALKKQLITPRQQEFRVAFATKYLQCDMAKWQQVLWSDKAVFTVS